ncbi:MAG: 3-isopropylmalate dehydratase small subunit [Pseudomonadales bacterium]|nr:3-isopropylmalate dehydratase small subunit [Pseudomonadales bacterium]
MSTAVRPDVFRVHTGDVLPLDRANVDTDQIIPKQFLKSIKRTGFGENLFDAWRFLDFGDIGKPLVEREVNPDFVLNDPRYRRVSILVARRNFGCGSSREHAVWSLQQYGFKVVIAPSFADIFHNNCYKNGLLPIRLSEAQVEFLFSRALGERALKLTIDLPSQLVCADSIEPIAFEIEHHRKRQLLHGLDEIGLTLEKSDLIRDFEREHRKSMPWLFA